MNINTNSIYKEINIPNYCHAIEVNDAQELESFLECFTDEYIYKHSFKAIKDFLCSLDVYCLDDTNEEEVYNFSIRDYLISLGFWNRSNSYAS